MTIERALGVLVLVLLCLVLLRVLGGTVFP